MLSKTLALFSVIVASITVPASIEMYDFSSSKSLTSVLEVYCHLYHKSENRHVHYPLLYPQP